MSNSKTDYTYIDATKLTLDEWLALIEENPKDTVFKRSTFPTEQHYDEFMSRIADWSDEDILNLLSSFLFTSTTFMLDELKLQELRRLLDEEPEAYARRMRISYYRRLVIHFLRDKAVLPWEGNHWILDLLPHSPKEAIASLDAYVLAHWQILPDGRLSGLLCAIEIIRARYIGLPGSRPETVEFLEKLSPRAFECLVESLYAAMGYDTELTSPSKDGGRDIIATRTSPAQKEIALIECKRYRKKVNVNIMRSLLGVTSDEKVNKGVLVTTSGFTRPAKELAANNPRLEAISGNELCLLLNEHLGPNWPLHIERIVLEREERASKQRSSVA